MKLSKENKQTMLLILSMSTAAFLTTIFLATCDDPKPQALKSIKRGGITFGVTLLIGLVSLIVKQCFVDNKKPPLLPRQVARDPENSAALRFFSEQSNVALQCLQRQLDTVNTEKNMLQKQVEQLRKYEHVQNVMQGAMLARQYPLANQMPLQHQSVSFFSPPAVVNEVSPLVLASEDSSDQNVRLVRSNRVQERCSLL